MPVSKNVTRLGDICSGHGCWPPRPNGQGSPNVFTNFLPTHRRTDYWITHCCVSCHSSVLAKGSPSVFANYLDVSRISDPVACGSVVAQGSPNVYAGEEWSNPTIVFTTATAYIPPVPADTAEQDSPSRPEPGVQIVQGKRVYENTPEGHAALKRDEAAVSSSLPTYHEDKPGQSGPTEQQEPKREPVPPEGCKNSKYFTLADSKMQIKAQSGLTKEQIECNWIALCTNILDKLRDEGFNFKINSAFRTTEYNASIGSTNNSDHTTGCAADLSLGSQEANKKMFKALLNKYPYSQLIFEGNWVHVAYGGRGPKGNAKVMYTYTGKSPQIAGVTGGNLPGDLQA